MEKLKEWVQFAIADRMKIGRFVAPLLSVEISACLVGY
tara:strand:- start:245 stop:358 length:114 start_codon:yes stop_codon:yes gene_type:complete